MIKNYRLWLAAKALCTSEGDVRHRVAIACDILDVIREKELTEELKIRLDKVLEEAGKKGPLVTVENVVIRGKYEQTLINRRNSTYKKLAEEIFNINEEFNNR